MVVKLVVLVIVLAFSFVGSGGVSISRHIKRLNKPAVKSIKSPDGDVIDCVHISLQPAFDHPFLKNHTIQMIPSFHPDGLHDVNKFNSESISQLWHNNGKCPQNTVPIRRTKRKDILRASSIKSFGRKKQLNLKHPMASESDLQNFSAHEHAFAYVQGGKYYGTKATINLWNPQVQQNNEFSLSQLWVLGGTLGQDLNSIEAGWQVSQEIYGDNNTRLFTYWTSDSYEKTGCYNLRCSGFVQTSSEIAMGGSLSPISVSGGSQYDISLLVWKDPKEGHWWLKFQDKYVLGYWPSSLFSYLADSASMIEWGGEVVNLEEGGQHTTTQMGSGHFPEDGFSKASYFKNIEVVDETNTLIPPTGMTSFAKKSSCYNVQIGNSGGAWGHHFFYGGPGRNPNCP